MVYNFENCCGPDYSTYIFIFLAAVTALYRPCLEHWCQCRSSGIGLYDSSIAFRGLSYRIVKMTSSTEVKKEIEERLSEANANEKYLYNRVTELERRNQRLEKKVAKLKRKKKELKQEVAKLREKVLSERSGEAEEMTGQDEDFAVEEGEVEVVDMEEAILSRVLRSSNIEGENVDTNSNANFADEVDEQAESEETQRLCSSRAKERHQ